MAKVIGPLFSMRVSGALGEIIFDRRGFVRLKGNYRDARTASQINFRQTLRVAQCCVKVCGPTTRQQLKQRMTGASRWNTYLVKKLIGPKQSLYLEKMNRFADATVDQAGWEAAAAAIGLREVRLNNAAAAPISPGAQLFVLASTLYEIGIYTGLGQPVTNAEEWKTQIVL
ncbi:MAG: hypothetical protein HYR94_05460 [Chloroflexi bacterium]|nr:hypothetical protein [Chloroflexota bacterium]